MWSSRIMYWHFSKHKSILSNTFLLLRPIFMLLKNSPNFPEDMCYFYICSCGPRNFGGIECHFYKSITWRFSCRQANKQTNTKKNLLVYKRYSPRGNWWGTELLTFKLVSRTLSSHGTVNGAQASRCNTVSAAQLPLNRKENTYTNIIQLLVYLPAISELND